MGRTKQGGSILGYVIVGGVLTILLLGGAYALRNNWSTNPADSSGDVAQQPSKSQEDAAQDKKDAPVATPAPQPATPSAPESPSATQLPQTGPADTVVSVVVMLVVIASISLYLQSRRAATASL